MSKQNEETKAVRSDVLKNKIDSVKSHFEKHGDVIDVNAVDKSGNSIVMIAVINGSVDLVSFLVSKGADIKHVNNEGCNALHCLLPRSKTLDENTLTDMVTYLLSQGLSPLDRINNGTFALETCTQASSNVLLKLFVSWKDRCDLLDLKKCIFSTNPKNFDVKPWEELIEKLTAPTAAATTQETYEPIVAAVEQQKEEQPEQEQMNLYENEATSEMKQQQAAKKKQLENMRKFSEARQRHTKELYRSTR